jgi:hypothetical protein
MLTAGIDNGAAFTGGSGADAFNATHLTFGASDVLVGGAGVDTLTIVDTGTAAYAPAFASVSGIENINIRNLNGTAAVAEVAGVTAVNEVQTVTVTGAAVGTATSFLGVNTTVVAADDAATSGGKIIANKANILAGQVAKDLGIIDITAGATNDLIRLTFGGLNGKGDVAPTAAWTANNGTTFSAGVQAVQGVLGVTAVAAVASTSQTDTVDATKFTDATTFASDASTGLVNFTGLTAAQTAVKKAGAGGFGAGFGATVTSGTVEISSGSTAGNVAITGSAFTTATINSTGAANTIGTFTGAVTTTTATTINATTNLTLTGAATNLGATVTVNGAGNVNLGVATSAAGVVTTNALESGVTTLNAAGLTGNLTVALGSAVTQKVTGGAGADTIFTGATLTTGSVDAGAGTDVLALTNAAHLASPTLAAKYTNFETLRINTGITQDMANAPASITAVQTMGVATVSNMTPAQAAAVQMRTNATAGTADALSFALASAAGTSDVLNIVAGVGTTTTGALDIAALTVTGFETLNIQANAGPSSTAGAGGAGDKTTFVTGTITGATLNTINLTGTAVNIANVAIANATAGVNINGSALTGDGLAAASQAGLTVAGSAFVGSTITGSGVRDVFTIGAEGSAYNGGGGNDRMTTTVAILVADGVTDGTMNGGDGTDTLVVSDTTGNTLTDNHFTKLTGFEGLTLTNTGAGDTRITTGGAFNAAFATGATITSGIIAATQDIEIAAGLATVPVTVSIAATSQTGAATEINIITTGSAADSVTYTDTDFVGVNGAAAQGQVIVSTRGGDDTIAITVGTLLGNSDGTDTAVVITGGAGKDTITKVGTNGAGINGVAHYVMAAGDSSISARDVITGFDVADGTAFSDLLNFEGTATVTAFSNSIDFGTILSHSVTGGIVTFDTAATFAAAKIVNANNLADVLGYLNANMGVNETAGFLFDSNGDGANDATMVFHQGSSLTTVADDVVELVGITGLSLNATTNTTTAGAIIIA